MDNKPSPEVSTQPVAAPVPSTQPPSPVEGTIWQQPPKKKRKGLIVGIIIAVALVIVGAGSVLGYNLWYQNPDKVVYDALINAFKAKSITGDGELVVKAGDVNIKVTFDTKGEGSNGLLTAKAVIDGDIEGQKIAVDVTGSVITKEDVVYFKLDNVRKTVDDIAKASGATVPEYFDIIIKKIDGQWVSVKSSDYEDISKEVAAQQECVTKTFDSLSTDDKMKREVIDLYKENKIIVIDDTLPAKEINGVASLGYTITSDNGAAKTFIKGLDDTAFGKALKECDDSVDFSEAAKGIDVDTNSNSRVELWVSRFGHEITQVNITGKEGDASGSFVFNPIFNKEVIIEAPENAITFKQLQEDIQKAVEEFYANTYGDDYYTEDDISPYQYN